MTAHKKKSQSKSSTDYSSINEILLKKDNHLSKEEKQALREAIKSGSNVLAVGYERINSRGSIMFHRYILQHKHLSPASKLVFEVINFFCFVKGDNKCQVTLETLTKETGSSQSTVQRAIKQLKGVDYIDEESGEKVYEIFLNVIHTGYMQPDMYMIYYKNIKKTKA